MLLNVELNYAFKGAIGNSRDVDEAMLRVAVVGIEKRLVKNQKVLAVKQIVD